MLMTRRELVRDLTLGLGALALPGCSRPAPTRDPATVLGHHDLALVTGDDPVANVRRAIAELGGIERFVSRGDIVTIKPNFYYGHPAWFATTTDPAVVRTVCELCLNAGAKRILMLDMYMRRTISDEDGVGIKRLTSTLQDTYFALLADDRLYRDLDLKGRFELGKIGVARAVYECDAFINIPVAKSHGAARVTFGLKNLMGLIQDPEEWHDRYDLQRAIADFGESLRPTLTVVDATRGLLTGGPGWGGLVGDLRTIVAGVDPVAIDACCAGLAPWNGEDCAATCVPHIRHAAQLGAGTLDWRSLSHKVVTL
jgi:uncharacterized protein (DUF362 family)